MDKGRIFKVTGEDGEERVLRLNRPNQKLLSQGDFVYRQHFSSAIRAGILTNAEANKILKDRNIWNDDQEKEAADLRDDIRELEKKLDSPSLSNEYGQKICERLKKLRNELYDFTSLHSSITDNTAESMAHEARIKFYASECTVDNENGRKLFRSFDDLNDRLDETEALSAYREALIANFERILGVEMPSGLAAELPENRWLKSREQKEEESKATTKKKTRKKRTTKKDKAQA